MNEIKIFENPQFGALRTTEKNGELWFVGKDVADTLGYQNGSRDINRHVDDEDRYKVMLFDGKQNKETIIINESGVYSLILSSKLPSAKAFKHWVTSEILPSISRTGGYIYGQEELSDTELMAKALLVAQRQIEQREQRINALETANKRLIPDAEYGRSLQATDGITVTSIAKEFGTSAQNLNKILHKLGIQYRQSDQWMLYKKYAGMGLVVTKTINITRADGRRDTKRETRWTMKGHRFIRDKLREYGYLPPINLVGS